MPPDARGPLDFIRQEKHISQCITVLDFRPWCTGSWWPKHTGELAMLKPIALNLNLSQNGSEIINLKQLKRFHLYLLYSQKNLYFKHAIVDCTSFLSDSRSPTFLSWICGTFRDHWWYFLRAEEHDVLHTNILRVCFHTRIPFFAIPRSAQPTMKLKTHIYLSVLSTLLGSTYHIRQLRICGWRCDLPNPAQKSQSDAICHISVPQRKRAPFR